MSTMREALFNAGLISEKKSVNVEEQIQYSIIEKDTTEDKNENKKYFQCLTCGRQSDSIMICQHCGGDVLEIEKIPKKVNHMRLDDDRNFVKIRKSKRYEENN